MFPETNAGPFIHGLDGTGRNALSKPCSRYRFVTIPIGLLLRTHRTELYDRVNKKLNSRENNFIHP